MKRPNFEPIFSEKSDYSEVCDSKPVETFIPKQAISISELIQRFERGQRLNIHSNFAPGSNLLNVTDNQAMAMIKAENMDSDDFPPVGVTDISDVEAHYREHEVHKADYSARMRKKAEERKQAQRKPASEPSTANSPENPPQDPA